MSEPEKRDEPKPAEADGSAAAAPAAEPAPSPEAEAATVPAVDAPPHPAVAKLGAAVDHFVAGNFAAARREVGELLKGEVPPQIRKQADELVRRLGLDPVAVWVAVGSTLLFIIVVFLTYRH